MKLGGTSQDLPLPIPESQCSDGGAGNGITLLVGYVHFAIAAGDGSDNLLNAMVIRSEDVVLALGLDAPPLYLVEDSPANPLHVPLGRLARSSPKTAAILIDSRNNRSDLLVSSDDLGIWG